MTLRAGVDAAVFALWLSHADIRSTRTFPDADMTVRQRAFERTTPSGSPPGRFNRLFGDGGDDPSPA